MFHGEVIRVSISATIPEGNLNRAVVSWSTSLSIVQLAASTAGSSPRKSTAPMDRVAAPEIHQRAAARFANVPELSRLRGNEMVERGLQRMNPAQPSRCNLLGRVAEYGVIDVMEGLDQATTARPAGGHHRPGLRRSHRERLLAEHVLAGFESEKRIPTVIVRGQGIVDKIDIPVRDQVLIALIKAWYFVCPREGLGLSGPRRRDRHDLDIPSSCRGLEDSHLGDPRRS